MAGEFRKKGVGVNALWPRTTIATAAIKNIVGGEEMMKRSERRKSWQMQHTDFDTRCQSAQETFIDEDLLRESGVTDLKIILLSQS